MKTIVDVQLKHVRVCIEKGDILVFKFSISQYSSNAPQIETSGYFNLTKSNGMAKLIQLLKYTKGYDVDDLNGEIVRAAVNEESIPYAFGHENEDSFFKLNGEFAIFTEEEILKQ